MNPEPLTQAQKRALLELLDEFGDAQFWLGRYTEIMQRGSKIVQPQKDKHHTEATCVRERFKSLLFPKGVE